MKVIYNYQGKEYTYDTNIKCDMIGCGMGQEGVHQTAIGVHIPECSLDINNKEHRPYVWCELHMKEVAGDRYIPFKELKMRKYFEVTIINSGDQMINLGYDDQSWDHISTIICYPNRESQFTRSFDKDSMVSLKVNLLYLKTLSLPKDYKLQILIRLLPEG